MGLYPSCAETLLASLTSVIDAELRKKKMCFHLLEQWRFTVCCVCVFKLIKKTCDKSLQQESNHTHTAVRYQTHKIQTECYFWPFLSIYLCILQCPRVCVGLWISLLTLDSIFKWCQRFLGQHLLHNQRAVYLGCSSAFKEKTTKWLKLFCGVI